jgi:hypothetical protein
MQFAAEREIALHYTLEDSNKTAHMPWKTRR